MYIKKNAFLKNSEKGGIERAQLVLAQPRPPPAGTGPTWPRGREAVPAPKPSGWRKARLSASGPGKEPSASQPEPAEGAGPDTRDPGRWAEPKDHRLVPGTAPSPSRAEIPPPVSPRSRKSRPLARRRRPVRVSTRPATPPGELLAGGAEVYVPEPSPRGGVTPAAPGPGPRPAPGCGRRGPFLPRSGRRGKFAVGRRGGPRRSPTLASCGPSRARRVHRVVFIGRERRLVRTAPGKGGAAAPRVIDGGTGWRR